MYLPSFTAGCLSDKLCADLSHCLNISAYQLLIQANYHGIDCSIAFAFIRRPSCERH